ncbi:MAG: PilZ domain-containing protein [Pirellulales bacterium]|nr:PilZ domain-containing protein [Pirellulales bacterium]
MTPTITQRTDKKRTRIFKGWGMAGQRRYERTSFFTPVKLTVLPDGPSIETNSFDISLGGVGLNSTVFIEPGKDVILRFHVADRLPDCKDEKIFGRVAYSRADEDVNRMGIEFLQPIHDSTHPSLTAILNSL